MTAPTDPAIARDTAKPLAALADPTRLRVLLLIIQEPGHVGRLVELTGVPLSNISHHLMVLRRARVLEDRRDGRRMVYSLHPTVFAGGTLAVGRWRLTLAPAGGPATGKGKKGGAG